MLAPRRHDWAAGHARVCGWPAQPRNQGRHRAPPRQGEVKRRRARPAMCWPAVVATHRRAATVDARALRLGTWPVGSLPARELTCGGGGVAAAEVATRSAEARPV
eukprot:5970392-Prymnesium_polylepis.1